MAGSTKVEFKPSVMQRSSTEPSAEKIDSYIIAPGLDLLYGFLFYYGLPLIVLASLILSGLYMWNVDFSGGK